MTYLEEVLNKIGKPGLSELDLIARGWTFERVFITKHKEEIPVYRNKKWLAYVLTNGEVKVVGGLPEAEPVEAEPANDLALSSSKGVQVLSMSEGLALSLSEWIE